MSDLHATPQPNRRDVLSGFGGAVAGITLLNHVVTNDATPGMRVADY